jgi:hypothetical protein
MVFRCLQELDRRWKVNDYGVRNFLLRKDILIICMGVIAKAKRAESSIFFFFYFLVEKGRFDRLRIEDTFFHSWLKWRDSCSYELMISCARHRVSQPRLGFQLRNNICPFPVPSVHPSSFLQKEKVNNKRVILNLNAA